MWRHTLSCTPSATCIPPHRHRLLVLEYIVEVGEGTRELPAIDGLGAFARLLERDSQVRTARAGRLGVLDVLRCVANLNGQSSSARLFKDSQKYKDIGKTLTMAAAKMRPLNTEEIVSWWLATSDVRKVSPVDALVSERIAKLRAPLHENCISQSSAATFLISSTGQKGYEAVLKLERASELAEF